MKLALLLVMAVTAIAAPLAAHGSSSTTPGRIPQAHAVRACAGAGLYWPTMTLALQGSTAWVACKEQARVVRLRLPAGRRTATLGLGGQVSAVAVGLGSVWALDSGSTLYRIDPARARVTRRIQLGASAAYNIWIGAGAVWVADDQGAALLRVSRSTNRVVARIPVGDGPADMVFRGDQAWAITHRDNTVFRIDTATNHATRLATSWAAPTRPPSDWRSWATGSGSPGVAWARRDGPDERRDPPDRRHRRHGHRRRLRRG